MMFLNMSMMMHEAAMQARNSKEQRLSIENLQLIPHDLYTIAEEENAIDIDDNDDYDCSDLGAVLVEQEEEAMRKRATAVRPTDDSGER
mmetsp:Transcript_5794/g.6224  ORF Transcript_5794/g.6224 Transcript_5794/m.6224 type:complete len:89 (-) Transcript_5794:982-1248(-)